TFEVQLVTLTVTAVAGSDIDAAAGSSQPPKIVTKPLGIPALSAANFWAAEGIAEPTLLSDSPQASYKDAKPETSPSSQEMGKLIVDYLISEGYREVTSVLLNYLQQNVVIVVVYVALLIPMNLFLEAAELLCQESGLELPKDDIKNLDARMNIRCAIIEGRLEDALRLVKELCPTLLDENREVRFHLMQQNLIEMIRRGEMEKSLEYAQENLSNDNMLTDTQLERLEKTFALLAFEKPSESPFGKLLDQSQRQMVSTEVNGAVLRALNRPAAPRLEALLRMIVWAQKQLITEREDDKTSVPPYPNAGRYGMPTSGPSSDTNTIARTLFGGTSC
uniref:CTLH domain-containing protein n=1 Tax=Angiostrongylus cantonensis TaxID=6313 RepID=A0A158PC87_ANGCA